MFTTLLHTYEDAFMSRGLLSALSSCNEFSVFSSFCLVLSGLPPRLWGGVCEMAEVINEAPAPASSLPPPSPSLILFLCCLAALHGSRQALFCCPQSAAARLILWTFRISPSSPLPSCFLVYLLSDLAAPVAPEVQCQFTRASLGLRGRDKAARRGGGGAAKDTGGVQ